jgi:6-pyruvoyltetrahydropterin/6-carboxytetrahydropterin synthase
MRYEIRKQFQFEAAHYLVGLPDNHKCGRLHGHSYKVEIVLVGELDNRGFVVDYGDLSSFGAYLDNTFDHRLINEVVSFQTSAEHLSKHFYDWCKERWPQTVTARVSETGRTWASYPCMLPEA